jgi:murein DD-endopeptidase MepM/ murein hydrolase activator NlpD
MLSRKTRQCIGLAIAIMAVRSHGAAAGSLLATNLVPPVSAACISSPFGPRVLPNVPEAGTYHYGVDLPAPVGSAVVAAAPGSVIRVQRKGPGGLEMLVQHDGFVGIYSHFGMIAPAFAEGKRAVAAGEKLGVVGRTGVSLGAHLYFEMLLDGRPVDPTPYLGLPRCGGGATTTTARRDTDGVTVGGRKYYQLSLPDRQYSDWQQH